MTMNTHMYLSIACVITIITVSSFASFSTGFRRVAVDSWAEPAYLSFTRTIPLTPLTVVFQEHTLPCDVAISSLRSVPYPNTPIVVLDTNTHTNTHTGRNVLFVDDVVSLWTITMTPSERIYAACPGADRFLTIVGCVGRGVSVSAARLTLRDISVRGGEIHCAGPVERRLVEDICASAIPSFSVKTFVAPHLGDTDAVLAFMRPVGNKDVAAALSRPGALVVTLPTIDPHVFALRQPLAKLSGNGSSAKISSTTVLVGPERLDGVHQVRSVVSILSDVDPFWAAGELNAASRHLLVADTTRSILNAYDAAASQRASHDPVKDIGIPTSSILHEAYVERFQTQSVGTLETNAAVPGYLVSTLRDGKARVFETESAFIGAVRMRIGDRVIISSQIVSKHDGKYIVSNTHKDGGATLVTWSEATYDAIAFVEIGNGRMRVSTSDLTSLARGELWPSAAAPLREGDLLLLRNLDNSRGLWSSVVGTSADGSSSVIEVHPRGEDLDKGSCVTTPEVTIRNLCKGVWDSPCTSDDQCPFFQSNTHYQNYRGGCLDGWCETPVGVTRVSYRNYTGKAVCHGCRDVDCCEGAPAPDIAFPFDEFERSATSEKQNYKH